MAGYNNEDIINVMQMLFGRGPISNYQFTPPPPCMGQSPFDQNKYVNNDIPPGTIDLTFEEIKDEPDSQ